MLLPITEQQVALITGCSTGLGEALALKLHAVGYHVVATARRVESLDHLAAFGISCLSMDVTDDDSVKNTVGQIMQSVGRVDVCINNAGMSALGPIVEQPLSEVRQVLETNLIGVIRVNQVVVPAMAARGRGLIVNIGSVTCQMTTPWSAAYSGSKAALLAVTDALRLEVKPFGIGVTYVVAGAMKSALADNTTARANYDMYKSDSSLYSHWGDSIRMRAHLSQGDGAVSAEVAAAQIVAVIEKTMRKNPPFPPIWFFAGGKARTYWFVGLLQKVFGWPINAVMMKRFSLAGPKVRTTESNTLRE